MAHKKAVAWRLPKSNSRRCATSLLRPPPRSTSTPTAPCGWPRSVNRCPGGYWPCCWSSPTRSVRVPGRSSRPAPTRVAGRPSTTAPATMAAPGVTWADAATGSTIGCFVPAEATGTHRTEPSGPNHRPFPLGCSNFGCCVTAALRPGGGVAGFLANPVRLSSARKTARRITRLIAQIQRVQFSGIGKPEPLREDLRLLVATNRRRRSTRPSGRRQRSQGSQNQRSLLMAIGPSELRQIGFVIFLPRKRNLHRHPGC